MAKRVKTEPADPMMTYNSNVQRIPGSEIVLSRIRGEFKQASERYAQAASDLEELIDAGMCNTDRAQLLAVRLRRRADDADAFERRIATLASRAADDFPTDDQSASMFDPNEETTIIDLASAEVGVELRLLNEAAMQNLLDSAMRKPVPLADVDPTE